MVSFDTPCPRVLGIARVAEHGEVIKFRVAPEADYAGVLLDLAERGFEVDNLRRLLIRALGQAALHDGVRELALVVVHVAQWQAVPVQRRVVPEDALAVHILVSSLVPLLRREAVKPVRRRVRHLPRRVRVGMSVGMGVFRCHLRSFPIVALSRICLPLRITV